MTATDDRRDHRRAEYPAATRAWAIAEYEKSRHNYSSRSECVAALALTIGAHENTVARWIKQQLGSARSPAADEMTVRLRASEADNERLRRENRSLTEQLAAKQPRSITAESLGTATVFGTGSSIGTAAL
ncbi:transposase [Rhodococcoides kyotonense]|uniref:Transposase n=1 Tax=Rhodococcoides kyotonense TaxID=398843 RepID=A0A177YF00_9NOCA|nr:transposase [Rhodococcus kyotonensis]OAK53799.1 transposase [Rhodococcus kyotonensis]